MATAIIKELLIQGTAQLNGITVFINYDTIPPTSGNNPFAASIDMTKSDSQINRQIADSIRANASSFGTTVDDVIFQSFARY